MPMISAHRTRQTLPRAIVALSGAAAVTAAAAWSRADYQRWRALGDSGLAPNMRGWLRATALRVPALFPLDPNTFPAGGEHPLIFSLPHRVGPTPRTASYIVPHRVTTQLAPTQLTEKLQSMLVEFTSSPIFVMRTAGWERHSPALWLKHGPEIGHIHSTDGSSHVNLAPPDARTVIERNWGVLHPLAGKGGLSRTYTLLYPPRNDYESERVGAIFTAAAEQAAVTRRTRVQNLAHLL